MSSTTEKGLALRSAQDLTEPGKEAPWQVRRRTMRMRAVMRSLTGIIAMPVVDPWFDLAGLSRVLPCRGRLLLGACV